MADIENKPSTALASKGPTTIQEGPTRPADPDALPAHLGPLDRAHPTVDLPGGGKLTLHRDTLPPPRFVGVTYTSADGVSGTLDTDAIQKLTVGVLRRRMAIKR